MISVNFNTMMISKLNSVINAIATAMDISEDEAMKLVYTTRFANDIRNEDDILWQRSPIQLFQIFVEDYLAEDVNKYIN